MERDDIIEYSLDAHHSEEEGKKIRKKIWFVTLLLTIITAVEVCLGAYIKQGSGVWPFVKWSFIIMTLLKAAYIVLVFMHLGDEVKNLMMTIIVPLMLFIWFIAAFLIDGNSWRNLRNTRGGSYQYIEKTSEHIEAKKPGIE
jgi:cytochrome c oxidase subunit IV